MRIALVALSLAVAALASPEASLPGMAFALPAEVLNGEMALAMPVLLKTLQETTIPGTCCYDGPDSVHIMFRGNTLDKGNFRTSGSVTSSNAGLQFAISVSLQGQSDYDICIHDDPFGKGCSSVDGCHGTGVAVIESAGTFDATASVNAEGELILTPTNTKWATSLPKCSFCGKISGGIKGAMGDADKKIVTEITDKASAIFNSITPKLRSFDLKKFTLELDYVSAGTDSVGLYAAAAMTIINNDGGKRYPVVPTKALPNVASSASGTRFAVALSEGVLNTVGQMIYDDGLLKGQMNSTILGRNVTINWEARDAPTFYIGTGSGIVLLADVVTQMTLNDSELMFAPDLTLVLGASVTYEASQKGFMLQMSYLNLTVTNSTSSMQDVLATDIKNAIPTVNSQLSSMILPLPVLKEADLSNPAISYGAGYALLTADIALHLPLPPGKPMSFKCPDIPKFHGDGCI